MTSRFVGVDLARLLAIIGMMASHVWAPALWAGPDAAASVVDAMTAGVASALFAVLGGVSLVFATRGVASARGRSGVVLTAVTRALVITLIGVVLAAIPGSIVVVLVYFGIAMLFATPFLFARTGAITIALGVLWLFGGMLHRWLSAAEVYDGLGPSAWSRPGEALRDALVTGTYPVITWLAYMLAGMLVARLLLRVRASGRLRPSAWRLALAGAALAAAAVAVSAPASAASLPAWLGAQLVVTPHSGSVIEIARNIGVALAVIGLFVALADAGGRARAGRRPSFVLRWLAAAGAAPLTIYIVHVVLDDLVSDSLLRYGGLLWLSHVAVAALIALVLVLLRRRGPAETFVGFVARQVSRLAPAR